MTESKNVLIWAIIGFVWGVLIGMIGALTINNQGDSSLGGSESYKWALDQTTKFQVYRPAICLSKIRNNVDYITFNRSDGQAV